VDRHPPDPVIRQAVTVVDPNTAPGRIRSLFGWLFRNRRTGQITIAQFPNMALWLFFITIVLRQIVTPGTRARTAVDGAGLVALGWWAIDEVVRGVNPWRRILGLGGCGVVAAGVVALWP
jgi:hypothetical protein